VTDVGALLVVDGDTAAAGDVPDDRVAGAGEQQAAIWVSRSPEPSTCTFDAVCGSRRRRVERLDARLILQQRRAARGDPLAADRGVADGGEEVLDRVRVKSLRSSSCQSEETGRGGAARSTSSRPFSRFSWRAAREPLADLLAACRLTKPRF
jgi:hypothetical protein